MFLKYKTAGEEAGSGADVASKDAEILGRHKFSKISQL